jgi:hypothetical protein
VFSTLAGGTGDVLSIEALNGGLSPSHSQSRKPRGEDSTRLSLEDFSKTSWSIIVHSELDDPTSLF